MSNIGSNQLTSVYSKIVRKPINPSKKEKKSKFGDYPNKSRLKNLSN